MSPRVPEFGYSSNCLNRAGDAFRSGNYKQKEISILTEWRAVNAAQLSNIRSYLTRIINKAKISRNDVLVSQRLKRLPSIIDKLKRFSKMKLSKMQDISGIRVVCKDMAVLRKLTEIAKKSHFKLKKDYITNPIETGYRSVHLVKKLKSGVIVELQIRTELQHAWATSLEISDLLYPEEQKIKTDRQDKTLKSNRFAYFRLIGDLMSYDQYTQRYSELTQSEIIKNLTKLEQQHRYLDEIYAYTPILEINEKFFKNFCYSVIGLKINHEDKKITAHQYGYKNNQIEEALNKYEEMEGSEEFNDVVFIKAENLKKLKRAYPNYFGQAQLFCNFVSEKIKLSE